MITGIIGVILIFMAITLSRPVTTLIHELGHAIPSLLFTNGPVIVYVGSYGDTSNSTTTNLGRLRIIFKYRLVDLQLGLCQHQSTTTIWQSLIIILGGPIFSLLIAVGAAQLLPIFQEEQYIVFTIGIFITSGIVDFFANIIPSRAPLKMHDGRLVNNDGAQFLQTLKTSRYPSSYFEAMELLEEDKQSEAISKLELSIEQGVHDLPIYQLVMRLFRLKNQTSEAMAFHETYGSFFKLSSADYVEMGHFYEKNDFDRKAISYYSEAIKLDYTNVEALGLRGNLYLSLGHYEEGKADLKKVSLMSGADI